jgi:hypothetical protein
MKCPYCLNEKATFEVRPTTGSYHCTNCQTPIPRGFVDARNTPRATVGVVGFSGHGKTVYLTALFSALSKLSNYWQDYYYRCLDDYTHRILYQQVPLFDRGVLPESTPANFPNPALIHYKSLPGFGDSFVAFYDTAGEVFTESAQILRGGYFVAHANTALFILSLSDLDPERIDEQMSKLLDTYIRAAYDQLNLPLKQRQHLVVIFSKADLLRDRLTDELNEWLANGTAESYALNLKDTGFDVGLKSPAIAQWLRDTILATRFVNMASDRFLSVQYCLISATGMTPGKIEPLRVLDPFLLTMINATSDVDKKKGNWLQRIGGKLFRKS